MAKLVSKVYGDALFETARESGRMDEMYEEVQALQGILADNADLQKVLDNPKVMREEKESIIEHVFRGRVSDEIVELMRLMIDKGRYNHIGGVFDYFIGLVKEEKKIGVARVTTAVELKDQQKKDIVARLLEITGYTSFETQYAVDPDLIGGMVIRIGDRVVDTSIRTKLYDLSRDLRSIQV